MPKQRTKITPHKLRKAYYREHVSARAIAIKFNCSPTTIRNYLDRYGWRVKRRSEVMKGRKLQRKR